MNCGNWNQHFDWSNKMLLVTPVWRKYNFNSRTDDFIIDFTGAKPAIKFDPYLKIEVNSEHFLNAAIIYDIISKSKGPLITTNLIIVMNLW